MLSLTFPSEHFLLSSWILHHNKTSKHKSSNSCWAFLMSNDFLTVTVMFRGSSELKKTVEAAPDVYKACRPNWPQYQHFNTCFIPDTEFETFTVYQTQLDSTTKMNAPWRRRSTPFLSDMLPAFLHLCGEWFIQQQDNKPKHT